MQSERRHARAHSFGSVVDDYERGRPTYPTDAVVWLTGESPSNVIDLGAGTGKLTRPLADLGHEVVAVELSLRMASRLHERIPHVSAVCAAAEAIPLKNGWANVVTVGQAFHWFDADKSLPEIARVLAGGGRLGLIWNVRDESVAWVRELSEIVGSERIENKAWLTQLQNSPLFGPVERRSFEFKQILNRQELLALIRSRSYVATLSEKERTSLLDSIERLCDEHSDLADRDVFALPYETVAFCAVTVARESPG